MICWTDLALYHVDALILQVPHPPLLEELDLVLLPARPAHVVAEGEVLPLAEPVHVEVDSVDVFPVDEVAGGEVGLGQELDLEPRPAVGMDVFCGVRTRRVWCVSERRMRVCPSG